MPDHPTLRLISAIACRDARENADGFFIRDPLTPIVVPSEHRARAPLSVEIPPFKLVLTLYGGTPGTTRLRFSAQAATGEYGLGDEVSFDWPAGHLWQRVIVPVQSGSFYMAKEGDYAMRILAGGIPLGEVRVPLVWSDSLSH